MKCFKCMRKVMGVTSTSVTVLLCYIFQICRDINRIKVCMETGRTVILLNLESLYESLYDALNQVWIGLTSVRLPARVHPKRTLLTCTLLGRAILSTLLPSLKLCLSNSFQHLYIPGLNMIFYPHIEIPSPSVCLHQRI